jgi:hypothetical protein
LKLAEDSVGEEQKAVPEGDLSGTVLSIGVDQTLAVVVVVVVHTYCLATVDVECVDRNDYQSDAVHSLVVDCNNLRDELIVLEDILVVLEEHCMGPFDQFVD